MALMWKLTKGRAGGIGSVTDGPRWRQSRVKKDLDCTGLLLLIPLLLLLQVLHLLVLLLQHLVLLLLPPHRANNCLLHLLYTLHCIAALVEGFLSLTTRLLLIWGLTQNYFLFVLLRLWWQLLSPAPNNKANSDKVRFKQRPDLCTKKSQKPKANFSFDIWAFEPLFGHHCGHFVLKCAFPSPLMKHLANILGPLYIWFMIANMMTKDSDCHEMVG